MKTNKAVCCLNGCLALVGTVMRIDEFKLCLLRVLPERVATLELLQRTNRQIKVRGIQESLSTSIHLLLTGVEINLQLIITFK